MLTHHRLPVCLSFISTDLPIVSTIETAATLYQKNQEWFHLLLHQPGVVESVAESKTVEKSSQPNTANRLLWLEISPYRVIMTMQGNGKFAYRHFWERGIYGISRYWLNNDNIEQGQSFRLRNFTRTLTLDGHPLPHYLRLEYELWSEKLQLGHYILHLEIYH